MHPRWCRSPCTRRRKTKGTPRDALGGYSPQSCAFRGRKAERSKTKREFTFGSNKILLLVGLGTIAASLFSESFGSYYAAIGIAFTLGGFFWPSIEEHKTAVAAAGAGPRLAIETQHRSLDHRINGLASRSTSIKENLNSISLELENLGQGLDAPYVNEE